MASQNHCVLPSATVLQLLYNFHFTFYFSLHEIRACRLIKEVTWQIATHLGSTHDEGQCTAWKKRTVAQMRWRSWESPMCSTTAIRASISGCQPLWTGMSLKLLSSSRMQGWQPSLAWGLVTLVGSPADALLCNGCPVLHVLTHKLALIRVGIMQWHGFSPAQAWLDT